MKIPERSSTKDPSWYYPENQTDIRNCFNLIGLENYVLQDQLEFPNFILINDIHLKMPFFPSNLLAIYK